MATKSLPLDDVPFLRLACDNGKGISFFKISIQDGTRETKNGWLRFEDWEQDPQQIEVRWDTEAL